MEALRWILLGAGLLFVLVVYLLGRSRRTQIFGNNKTDSENLPEFSAHNGTVTEDNIADVHITARTADDPYLNQYSDGGDAQSIAELNANLDAETSVEESTFTDEQEESSQGLIVVTIIAKTEEGLRGDKINSAAIANNLKYGNMDIFHRMGGNAKAQFSVANMIEPGTFDADTIHELMTPGLTFFLQLPVYGSAMDALADMLECAYRISELLDARLCDKNRNTLTETEAERLRSIAKHYDSE